ncbi:MAG: hypothetical protein WB663_00925, partial [Beijerinckiaceae bacterium]
MIVDAGAHDVVLLASRDGEARAGAKQVGTVVAAEIGEQVLGLDRPIRREGIFEAGADSIANAHVVAVGRREEAGDAGNRRNRRRRQVAVAEGNAAGAVDDQTIEGETAAATHR